MLEVLHFDAYSSSLPVTTKFSKRTISEAVSCNHNVIHNAFQYAPFGKSHITVLPAHHGQLVSQAH